MVKQSSKVKTFNFKEGTYVGEVKGIRGDIPHGQGTHTIADGTKYIGEWKDGMMHGQGTYTLKGGAQYVGEFKDGMMHGQGTLTLGKGAVVLAGKWVNNKHVGP